MNRNIIIAGAIAIGLYLFSQQKKSIYETDAQRAVAYKEAVPAVSAIKKMAERMAAERLPSDATTAAKKE